MRYKVIPARALIQLLCSYNGFVLHIDINILLLFLKFY